MNELTLATQMTPGPKALFAYTGTCVVGGANASIPAEYAG